LIAKHLDRLACLDFSSSFSAAISTGHSTDSIPELRNLISWIILLSCRFL